jgi:hypothetical protein
MKQDSKRKIEKADAVLSELIDSLGLRTGLSRHNLVRLWPKIVDPVVLRHVQAEKVDGPTLHLLVDSSVWMNEMAAIKPILLEKVNACLSPDVPPITDIRFRQHSGMRPPAEGVPKASPTLTEQDRRTIHSILEPVEDDALKKVLERILEKDRLLQTRRKESTESKK